MFLRIEISNKYLPLEQNNKIKNSLLLFHFEESLNDKEVEELKYIVHNPVLQSCKVITEDMKFENKVVDILFLPGMTDNMATSVVSALAISPLKNKNVKVHSGISYSYLQNSSAEDLQINSMIHWVQEFSANTAWVFPQVFTSAKTTQASYEQVDVNILPSWISKRLLALNDIEIETIQAYFKSTLKRNPTDVEIEIIAQSWSEHCKHKIFAADYDYSEVAHHGKQIEAKEIRSLFSTYIKSTVKPHHTDCVSVFHDNAGVMRWDESIDLCIKVETHNSPSALDPFSGAVTGVLGVQRDIMGTGKGAKPIANLDVFCVGRPDEFPLIKEEERPQNLFSPDVILKGVHKGVEDGGNKMGVPTINGSFQFHPNFAGKPLVYVGSLGMMPRKIHDKECVNKEILVGDLVFVGGGRLGRDGIHGATFSSLSMEGEIPTSVVQIGDPITQKKLLDFTLIARDHGYIRGITDNGAGGISSSVGELSQYTGGVRIHIDRHPVKYEGLACFEMVISESQERMTYAVPPEHKIAFEKLALQMGVEVSHLGEFTNHGLFEILYNQNVIAKLPLEFLFDACPKMSLKAKWQGPQKPAYWYRKSRLQTVESIEQMAVKLLASPNIATKESWVRQYDHEVQGATIGKPFQGKTRSAPSNAGVIDLSLHGGKENTAVALAHGFSAKLATYDTYFMAQMAIDECIRNLVASGGNPKKIALLDNFCWPNPFLQSSEHRLGQLVRSCEAIKDMATLFDLPFISGKDSMKNSYVGKNQKGERITIDVEPSLLISGIAYVESHQDILSSSFVEEGNFIYQLGPKAKNLLGSEFSYYYETNEALEIPQYDFIEIKKIHEAVYQLIQNQLVESIHDISDGGALICLLEKMIGNQIGCKLEVEFTTLDAFGEAPGSYIISIKKQNQSVVESMLASLPFTYLGITQKSFLFEAKNAQLSGDQILQAWRTPIC